MLNMKEKLDYLYEIYKDKEQITYEDIYQICKEFYLYNDEHDFEKINIEVEGLFHRLGYPNIHLSYDMDNHKLNVDGNLYKARDTFIEMTDDAIEEYKRLCKESKGKDEIIKDLIHKDSISNEFIDNLYECALNLTMATADFMEYKSSNDQYASLILELEKCSVTIDQIVSVYRPDKCNPSVFSFKSKDEILKVLTDIVIKIESIKNTFFYMNHHNDHDKIKLMENLKSIKIKLQYLIIDQRVGVEE